MPLQTNHLNGNPATVSDLAPLAFAGYAHFTAMQMRDHSTRGLDLHLERLRRASDRLFGHSLPDRQITEYLRRAVTASGASDASISCFITSRPGEFAPAGERDELEVLVKVMDPVQAPTGPISLDVIRHERHLPDIKHVGEISKTLLLRQANARGFDDAAFLDRGGRLSEATIWNLAYWDGASVIWPEAEYLHGVTMQILARQLRALGVPQQTRAVRPTEIDERWSAAVMNSWTPGIPVSRIGDRQLVQEPAFPRLLHRAWARDSQNQLA